MIIKVNFPLSSITTFKLGGPAKLYLKTSSPEEAVAGILTARERKLNYVVLSGCSNVVFSDKGFAGLVIHFTDGKLNSKNIVVQGTKVTLSANLDWHQVVKKIATLGLAGFEKMSAIPGNVGGLVVGNAGAYEQFIGDKVEWVEIFDGEIIRKIKKVDCHFGYRDSIFKKKNWLVLRVCLKLKKGDPKKLLKEVKEIEKQRWQKFGQHPICAGSFFKNVELKKVPKKVLAKIDQTKITGGKLSVGYLIGEVVSKLKVGDIYIADFHNNFLMNRGKGKTADLLKLVKKIKQAVKKKFGIELEEEVRYIL
ncbi:MAG TPA: UDP-N-acetylmuramate dehydrogenase [Candidatus Paceibacterota bacterium]|nr:UDP-N-acetylmuramate dehydrogenase [Candidatus Paceibacterota bacterium]